MRCLNTVFFVAVVSVVCVVVVVVWEAKQPKIFGENFHVCAACALRLHTQKHMIHFLNGAIYTNFQSNSTLLFHPMMSNDPVLIYHSLPTS